MANKKVLITGVSGQDGLLLSEFLLEKNYDVYGMIRRTSHFDRSRLDRVKVVAKKFNSCFELCYGDVEDVPSLYRLLNDVKPDEIYNYASQSHVLLSYKEPEYTTRINANATLAMLEAMRFLKLNSRFYQACSSELFGEPTEIPQTERTPFQPKSPYAVSKLYSYWICNTYREAYGFYCCNGILYNHESPYRGENFVTRKITYSLARIKAGLQEKLQLGNYDAKRDWGFAGDYVEAMWLMLQQDAPDDYVIASGIQHSVREFVEQAAGLAGFNITWQRTGIAEVGIDNNTGKIIVEHDEKFYRPTELNHLVGNPEKARNKLNWSPKVSFQKLVEIMMMADLRLLNVL